MPRTRMAVKSTDAEPVDEGTNVPSRGDAFDHEGRAVSGAAPSSTQAPPGYDKAHLAGCVEAALFTAQRPMALGRLCQTLIDAGMLEADASPANVKACIAELNTSYEQSGRAFRIESVAGGYRAMTLGAFAAVAASVRGMTESTRLSRAAIETLAIIAYRQPITRVDIESIRGSATGEVLRTLLDKRLVTIVGRAEDLGRPMLYGTTRRFLEVFGLASLRDLPAAGVEAGTGGPAGVGGASGPDGPDGPDGPPADGAHAEMKLMAAAPRGAGVESDGGEG